MELLLLSNSTMPGEAFFTWPRPYVSAFLSGRKRVAFVPFAAAEAQQDAYTDRVAEVFAEFGVELFSLHKEKDPVGALSGADAVAVGGGNTFLLLRALYRTQLIKAINGAVKNGMPYIGWSAGSNVAGPTIMATTPKALYNQYIVRDTQLIPWQMKSQ